ncbi:hypothetical protein [Chishuiella changwenlii]|uniref:hypothetical protein n=1 Tax=Chishuiella changwenlii TaxID=1434701 RepID=UPI002FD8D1E3
MKLYQLLLFLSAITFAQNNSQQVFTYKYESKAKLSSKTNSKNFDLNKQIENELNKPHEIEVISNSVFSLIKVKESINNFQSTYQMNILPSPNWILNNFENKQSIEQAEGLNNIFIKDSIISIKIKPTGNYKKVLNIQGEEFTASDDNNDYIFLLAKNDSIAISPMYFQFENFIILEAFQKAKIKDEHDGYREIHYILDKIEDVKKNKQINFKKLNSKKTISRKEYNSINDLE